MDKRNILFVIGTRPNYIKVFPLYNAFLKLNEYNIKIIDTGQHYDLNMSDVFIKQFNLNDIICLDCHNKTPILQLADIMIKLHDLFINLKPLYVVVFGDVNSALGAAITANKMGISLIHIESGNRSFDTSMPEEINRKIIDSLSNYLFVSEPNGISNLLNEGIITYHDVDKKCHYVGNPMIDTLFYFKDDAFNMHTYKQYGLQMSNYILMTLHRPSNIDDNQQFQEIMDLVIFLARKYKVIISMHPRGETKISDYLKGEDNVMLLKAQAYLDFISLMIHSGIVVTDSGGIQEETTALGIPCITLRKNTERPITVTHGSNKIFEIINCNDIDEYIGEYFGKKIFREPIKYWDGNSASRIVDIVG